MAALLLSLATFHLGAAEPPTQIVLILADDLGAHDLGVTGSRLHETPNLDRLAREGMRFTQAYSACTVCSPTRAALMTGKHPARLKITDWIAGHDAPKAKLRPPADWQKQLPLTETTLAERARSAGTATAHVGKWHLGGEGFEPEQQGFDANLGGYFRGQPPSYFVPYGLPKLADGPPGEYLTDREGEEAAKFIVANRDRPFFLNYWPYAVHTPLQAKPELIEKYRRKAAQIGGAQTNATYAAMVESLDSAVGRILGAIEQAGISERTVVIFTSDNGGLVLGKEPPTSNAPLRSGKGSPYEGGVRVPLLVKWPGVTRAGSEGAEPVITMDVAATVAEALGPSRPDLQPVASTAAPPQPAANQLHDGHSLMPLLRQPAAKIVGREYLCWHYPHYHPGGATPYAAIRAGDWKLIQFYEDGRHELFNLRNDPGETTNLADQQPDQLTELAKKLFDWQGSVGAQWPMHNPAHVPKPAAQDADGAVLLHSRDATIHGTTLRYEPMPFKNTLGWWGRVEDWADWSFTITQPGTFEVEVLQGCGRGQGGSEVNVEVGGETLPFVVQETGHFQIFVPRQVGRVTLPAGTHTLALKPQRKQAGAVMDVRQVRLTPVATTTAAQLLPGKRSLWFGFDRYDFELGGRPVLVVAPKLEAPGRPWIWHGEFFGHKPNPDLALLGRGFHVVYLGVPDMLGSPEAVRSWDTLYVELTGKYGFAPKPALVGLSRGGLYCYNWAAANAEKVACLYGDAPVCDFRSWPGAFGKGKRSDRDWQLVLQQYGFKSDSEARAYTKNPVDNLAPLAAARVPLLHVFGDADEVVPWDENTGVIAARYPRLGGDITLIRKPGVQHHPHGLDDSTPIVDFLWRHAANQDAKAWLDRHGGGPLDAGARPLMRKLGTIDLDLVETTPVVVSGRLWRFEWVRWSEGSSRYWHNQRTTNHFRFRDPATGETTPPFADGHEFGSAFVHDGTVYVTGTIGRGQVNVFASRDLKSWESWTAVPAGRYGIFNTSICRAGDEFVLMFEIDKPAEEAGAAFTARFARSRDLRSWTMTPPECNYARDRYTAPHALRWLGGWFYNFFLEAHAGYEMRVVRSRDLVTWEASPLNPVLRHAPEDKLVANPKLTDAQRTRIALAKNLNNSDIDFCEWQGRLMINYSWGNQQGIEHLAEAVYDGTEAQFLRGWFPATAR